MELCLLDDERGRSFFFFFFFYRPSPITLFVFLFASLSLLRACLLVRRSFRQHTESALLPLSIKASKERE
jgi:hypothetical protein